MLRAPPASAYALVSLAALNLTMKKQIIPILLLSSALLISCGSVDSEELSAYKGEMEQFFATVSEIGDRMDAIDTESEDYKEQLITQLSKLESAFKAMAELEVPEKFESLGDLPDEAAENLAKASELYEQVLQDDSFNQELADAADEYYDRANQRIRYIITILHGELPEGDGVSVTYEE